MYHSLVPSSRREVGAYRFASHCLGEHRLALMSAEVEPLSHIDSPSYLRLISP